jgi:DNA polymerase III gamma/tau subunit
VETPWGIKTIEEPPRHAKFICRDDGSEQVLPSGHFRCQKFDLADTGELIARGLADSENRKSQYIPVAMECDAQAADGAHALVLSPF